MPSLVSSIPINLIQFGNIIALDVKASAIISVNFKEQFNKFNFFSDYRNYHGKEKRGGCLLKVK